MKKVLIIAGTRPEVIKLVPVYKAFKDHRDFDVLFLTTGQHDSFLIEPITKFFEIEVNNSIHITTQDQSLTDIAASLLQAIDKEIENHAPDLVVVQGDTTTSTMGSLAAFYRKIKVAHVEAGLRTYNRQSPYPEEANRRITALMTDFHFAPTIIAYENLKNENLEGQIVLVGNTVIDSLLDACERINANKQVYFEKFKFITEGFEKVILITGHRRENIGLYFEEIYRAILQIASQYHHFSFVYPLHTNPVVRAFAKEKLSNIPNIFLIEPLPYDEMIFLIQQSFIVMTDSGGLQEECPTLDKPVLVLRETTERPEGITAGCSILAGVEEKKIVNIFNQLANNETLYRSMSEAKNPYGDGDSSIRIVEYLRNHMI